MHKPAVLATIFFASIVALPTRAVRVSQAQTLAAEPAVPDGLQIVSLNLMRQTDPQVIARELQANPRLRNSDVLLLQEVVQPEGADSVAHLLAREMDRHVLFAPAFVLRAGVNEGLAIVSRYPLRDPGVLRLKANHLRFHTRKRIALSATAETPLGAVRIFNTHLDNRINSDAKVEQLAPVLEAASAFEGPRLIGGDLNTGNLYWLANVVPVPLLQGQAGAVARQMAEHGFATPFVSTGATYDLLGLRLDWLYVRDMRSVRSGIEPLDFSDHHAIWTVFQPVAGAALAHSAATP
ncbi:MAG: endonuclease/exonuclease/phosphatase family protein [Acidobacteria bacterium]|nr:endonuclease/exonuclease/phosphatase family protein [Acidobacteriota bacterium]